MDHRIPVHRFLLRGRPGVGKTTLARHVVESLRAHRIAVAGFTTEEIRREGRRVGFAVESVDGRSSVLAHVEFPGPPRVGRYGVDLDSFEEVALPTLAIPFEGVVVIDELGKMELASDRFVSSVVGLFEEEHVPVVATVHVYRHPFTDLLIGRNDTELVDVRRENRNKLADWLVSRLTESPL